MKFSLRAPCSNCPFRTDVEPYISEARAKEISDALLEQQATFSCHKTLDYNTDDESDCPTDTEHTQHCAGALIMLEHMDKPNQLMRIAERLGFYDRTKLKMDSPVHKNSTAFIKHMRSK